MAGSSQFRDRNGANRKQMLSHMSLEAPKALKKLPLFLASVNCINKIIPTLAKKNHTLRSLLRKSVKVVWTETRKNCSDDFKKSFANATESCQ